MSRRYTLHLTYIFATPETESMSHWTCSCDLAGGVVHWAVKIVLGTSPKDFYGARMLVPRPGVQDCIRNGESLVCLGET